MGVRTYCWEKEVTSNCSIRKDWKLVTDPVGVALPEAWHWCW